MASSLPDSPSSLHPLDFDLDLDSFLLHPHPEDADSDHRAIIAFPAPPPSPLPPFPSPSPPTAPSRAHPPPFRHRRCLFGHSSASSSSSSPPSGSRKQSAGANGANAKDGVRTRKASELDAVECRKQQRTLQNESSTSKKRGNYNCRKCGKPKRGHVCAVDDAPSSSFITPAAPVPASPHEQRAKQIQPSYRDKSPAEVRDHISEEFAHKLGPSAMGRRHGSAQSFTRKPCMNMSSSQTMLTDITPAASSSATSCSTNERFLRANTYNVQASATSLSTDSFAPKICLQQNEDVRDEDEEEGEEEKAEGEGESESEEELMPLSCMVQILSCLHPVDLSSAGSVCRRWRQCVEYAWLEIHKVELNISSSPKFNAMNGCNSEGFLPFVLRKCPNLRELSLVVSSSIGDNMLKCIISLSPQLSLLEISLDGDAVNSITGEGLRDLLRHCKCLNSLKLEGCRNLFEVELNGACLETLWLTGCSELKYMFLNCPRLSELSLDFLSCGEHRSDPKADNLAAIMKNVGNTLKGLKRLHVASHLLDDRVVHALLSTGLRSLSMLSLTFGGGITDTSVDTIVSNCHRLELLDLSGSSITNKALHMISNSFSSTLTKLFLALCHNISHIGVEMVVSQLPRLQLLDCGKVIVNNRKTMNQTSVGANDEDGDGDDDDDDDDDNVYYKSRKSSVCVLQLYHPELEKLSLWGCSGLQELILDCPNLVDLNLTSCSKLRPDGLQLHCPALREVHVGKCREECVDKIQYQMDHDLFDPTRVVWRRQADGSKRVHAPRIAEEPSICSTP